MRLSVDRQMFAPQDLYELFIMKHGGAEKIGWAPRRSLRFGYFQPADYYEAVLNQLVSDGIDWIDVGGGCSLVPSNRPLAQALSQRVHRLVGVDPSDYIRANPFVHERIQCRLEEYKTDELFDLATLRMVAEHIVDPQKVIKALHRLLRPDGRVVVLTPNFWSATTLIAKLLPFRLHEPITKFFWGAPVDEGIFPTVYKMNTRKQLKALFGESGFREERFFYLDDLAVFAHFKWLNCTELVLWRILKQLGLPYPESCLLGVYQKR